MPGRHSHVENVRNQSAKPIGSPATSAITDSATGSSPKSAAARSACVPTTRPIARSYSASARIREKINSTSECSAGRMRSEPSNWASSAAAEVGRTLLHEREHPLEEVLRLGALLLERRFQVEQVFEPGVQAVVDRALDVGVGAGWPGRKALGEPLDSVSQLMIR